MSRSRRHTPIIGFTTAKSEKGDKKLWHKKYRAKIREYIEEGDFDEKPPPVIRETSDVWSMAKDGRRWVNTEEHPKGAEEMMFRWEMEMPEQREEPKQVNKPFDWATWSEMIDHGYDLDMKARDDLKRDLKFPEYQLYRVTFPNGSDIVFHGKPDLDKFLAKEQGLKSLGLLDITQIEDPQLYPCKEQGGDTV